MGQRTNGVRSEPADATSCCAPAAGRGRARRRERCRYRRDRRRHWRRCRKRCRDRGRGWGSRRRGAPATWRTTASSRSRESEAGIQHRNRRVQTGLLRLHDGERLHGELSDTHATPRDSIYQGSELRPLKRYPTCAWFRTCCCSIVLLVCSTGVWAASELQIPKPSDPLKPAPPPPALEPSVVNLEVRLPAEELAVAVDQAFPQVSAREDNWDNAGTLGGREDFRFLYRLVRGPFRYRMDHDHFDVWFDQVRYRIWARMNQGGTMVEVFFCNGDHPPRRLNLSTRSALTWSDTWRIQSRTTFGEPTFVEPCRLEGLDLDATPLLKSVLEPRLTALAQSIDRIIHERTEAKKRAETVWQKIQEPVELGPNRWLQFNPRDARVSPITSHGTQVVQTSVNLVMEPKVLNGSRPASTQVPLPPLQLAPLALEGFHLALPITIEYG